MPDDPGRETHPPSSWVLVVIAWALAGLPLLWGVLMTLKTASKLFRTG